MPKETVLRYIEAINNHDTETLYKLMAKEHVFIGIYDDMVRGRAAMREAWSTYFSWFPDYRIDVDALLEDDGTVAIFGHASGTYRGKHAADKRYHWRLPAAWRSVSRNGQILLWQVYCDTKIPYETMDRPDQEKVTSLRPW